MINYDEKLKLFESTLEKQKGFVMFGKQRNYPVLKFGDKEEIRVKHIKALNEKSKEINQEGLTEEEKFAKLNEILEICYFIILKILGITKKELKEQNLDYKQLMDITLECLTFVFGKETNEKKTE